ncbi:MAG: hypothetical protein B6U76_00060 [Desulfurococcales archaeon ex4484_217_2]|nr:MAG: hypothetical protein B6U76_00060 [Desulfurococcales archaeon ex4484_217_2]
MNSNQQEEQKEYTSNGMLTDIAYGVSEYTECDSVINPPGVQRGVLLEKKLSTIVDLLGEVGCITNNLIDVDFLLMIVASYIMAKKSGSLEDTEVKTPAELFEERIIPIIEGESEVVIEKIEE